MHRNFGPLGVVCMSVTIDDKDDADKALAFLKKQDARIANYHLDEPAETQEKSLGSTALPAVIIYGCDGTRAKLFTPDSDFDYKDVEKVVRGLLK